MCQWESGEVAVGTAVCLLQVQQQGPRAGAAALTLRLSPLLEWHLALQGPDSRLTESWLRPSPSCVPLSAWRCFFTSGQRLSAKSICVLSRGLKAVVSGLESLPATFQGGRTQPSCSGVLAEGQTPVPGRPAVRAALGAVRPLRLRRHCHTHHCGLRHGYSGTRD